MKQTFTPSAERNRHKKLAFQVIRIVFQRAIYNLTAKEF
jgi:hypothetical protein